jgi:quercetin dioxygenase-like cupin family protein
MAGIPIEPDAVRRIVTGHDASGRSAFIADGVAPRVYRPHSGIASTELWQTRSAPADNAGNADATEHPFALHPAPNGTVFRIIEFLPAERHADEFRRSLQDKDDGSGLVNALRTGSGGRELGFHRTNSTDYVIVLSGEIHALMDEGELAMRAGDVLIQRGTNHAWINRTDEPAVLAFVLVDAEPAPGGG